jgi:carbamoyl-phosphate synthase large subunit
MSVSRRERNGLDKVAKGFAELGFRIKATEGTHKYLAEHGIASDLIPKLDAGRPNVLDVIMNGEVQLVINTPAGKESRIDDSYIRKAAIRRRVPYVTTLAAAAASVQGIAAIRKGRGTVKSLQAYLADLPA